MTVDDNRKWLLINLNFHLDWTFRDHKKKNRELLVSFVNAAVCLTNLSRNVTNLRFKSFHLIE